MTDTPRQSPLHRLVYHSRFSPSFPQAEADQDREIGLIIRASVRNNRAAAITGMLLVRGQQFLQALEGRAEAVAAAYSRIRYDMRHTDATLIHSGPAERREFADWHMCAHRLSKADDAILQTLDKGLTADLSTLNAERALRLLCRVRQVQASSQARSVAL